MERRLAAIFLADVAGYSRLMGADEAGTLTAMKAHRAELWEPAVKKHDGRIVNGAGDSVLIEFASVVAAVECAIEVQAGMAERNADLPEDKRMLARIGVNIDEVIVEEGEIYGDGVNIAARLEDMAPPGGVCISGGAYEQVRDRIDASFTDLGQNKVKNISRPVRVPYP